MDTTLLSPEQETLFLKEKYNKLVDLCSALKAENERLKKKNALLEENEQNLEEKLADCFQKLHNYPDNISGTLLNFFAAFTSVIKKAAEQNAFIPYSYTSKYAKDYLKIEKSIFEALIMESTTIPLKTFKDYCARFLLIKSEDDNHKVTFTSNKLQIYYINKTALSCIEADKIPDAPEDSSCSTAI